MTDAKIEPALTAEEWAETRAENDLHESVAYWTAIKLYAPAIALLNDALPDSDPRKITRGKLDYLREVARTQSAALAKIGEDLVATRMIAFADALESYLPPAT